MQPLIPLVERKEKETFLPQHFRIKDMVIDKKGWRRFDLFVSQRVICLSGKKKYCWGDKSNEHNRWLDEEESARSDFKGNIMDRMNIQALNRSLNCGMGLLSNYAVQIGLFTGMTYPMVCPRNL